MAQVQIDECFGCVLGVYDDIDLTRNSGIVTGTTKDVFLGIKYDPNAGFDGLKAVEFSITGLSSFIVTKEPFDNPTVALGEPAAPADTLVGSGGMNLAWANCLNGDRALMKMTLIILGAVDDNTVLQVVRKFPRSNPNADQHFNQCDDPAFTITRVTGGCYVLNPVGTLPCSVAVEESTWSAIKTLYRN
ncbi:MAG: hypothetical protein ACE5G2_00355 [Candidatus Krumholzibacteriia bacterium]